MLKKQARCVAGFMFSCCRLNITGRYHRPPKKFEDDYSSLDKAQLSVKHSGHLDDLTFTTVDSSWPMREP